MYFPEYEVAKERMAEAMRDREQDRLGRQLRLVARGSRRSLGVRSMAFVTALFRA
ncbi:MAG: hypothetical protein ACR2HO_12855 [Rubrobacteraceae bacterium]|nr:hypothetical protein [Rubrobacter sp.]